MPFVPWGDSIKYGDIIRVAIVGSSPRAIKPVEDKPTLEHIRNIEVVTGGRFYIDREGKPTYKSRYARNA